MTYTVEGVIVSKPQQLQFLASSTTATAAAVYQKEALPNKFVTVACLVSAIRWRIPKLRITITGALYAV